ncbi:amino acid adenylation domain-containing protein [Niallia sp. FSL W8-1348]|uniref:amino acid adenylation domain-containing protein n=1 Tax=Niallia sp. FSL W8-1348 TaxID=2954656 RepID=UPI0030F6A2E3
MRTSDNFCGLFEEIVNENHNEYALISPNISYTYDELNKKANRIAHLLQQRGIENKKIVAIYLPRTINIIPIILGILKTGASYLPIDKAYPLNRVEYILNDSSADLVITDRSASLTNLQGSLMIEDIEKQLAHYPSHNLNISISSKSLMYIIYTSGTTGKPKGVMITHQSLLAFVRGVKNQYNLSSEDRMLQFFPIGFDGSVDEIYPSLLSGSKLIFSGKETLGFDDLIDCCYEFNINIIDLPTAYWHEFVDYLNYTKHKNLPPSVRLIILGGEKMQLDKYRNWKENTSAAIKLLNTYGPTETTVEVTAYELGRLTDTLDEIPLGSSIGENKIYLLDENLNQVKAEEIGTIYVGGPQLSRGYLNKPSYTAERFLPNPFDQTVGERIYNTGDLGKINSQGLLDYIGRTDNQIKIDGHRIDISDIEITLQTMQDIKQAIVGTFESDGSKLLVAYIVSRDKDLRTEKIRSYLNSKLPKYMIPSRYHLINEIPLNTNGKTDMKQLSKLNLSYLVVNKSYNNEKLDKLNTLLVNVFKVESIHPNTNLYDLGLNSLKSIQIMSRIKNVFGVTDITLAEIFNINKTIDLLNLINSKENNTTKQSKFQILKPVKNKERLDIPLTYSQEMVLFLNALNEDNLAYNTQLSINFNGNLNIRYLEGAFTKIIERHEIFRTTFTLKNGRPVQNVHKPFKAHISVVDLADMDSVKQTAEIQNIMNEQFSYKYNAQKLPLIRWKLIKLNDHSHILTQTEHHFVHDGWSLTRLMYELKEIYNSLAKNEPIGLKELEIQFSDYCIWQRENIKLDNLNSELQFWKGNLKDAPCTEIPTDYKRPRIQSFSGDAFYMIVEDENVEHVKKIAKEEKSSLYIVLLSIFNILMSERTESNDIVVGSSVANRHFDQTEELIGMLVNPIVLRTKFSYNNTFKELVNITKKVLLNAQENKNMPFELLVRELKLKRDLSRNPIFQVNFAFHDALMPNLDLYEVEGEIVYHHNASAKFDINITGIPLNDKQKILFEWEFNKELYHQKSIENLMSDYKNLMDIVLSDNNLTISDIISTFRKVKKQLVNN